MGTPAFGARVLDGLLSANLNITGVYTQPDRPSGRGMAQRESAVKQLAHKHGLPVFQPANFRSAEACAELSALEPDFLVVAAYGLILPQNVLDIPRLAPLNVHASLLPKYRGAAPIQRAIQENWLPGARTGVSIMRVVRELDAGPVYASSEVVINNRDFLELSDVLARTGAQLLAEVLPKITSGQLEPQAQAEGSATYAHKVAKADGIIGWNKPVLEVDALVRAMNPWPGAQAKLELAGKITPVLIRSGRPGQSPAQDAPGAILRAKSGLAIACSDGWYELGRLQVQGRKEMEAREFANGQRLHEGLVGKAL